MVKARYRENYHQSGHSRKEASTFVSPTPQLSRWCWEMAFGCSNIHSLTEDIVSWCFMWFRDITWLTWIIEPWSSWSESFAQVASLLFDLRLLWERPEAAQILRRAANVVAPQHRGSSGWKLMGPVKSQVDALELSKVGGIRFKLLPVLIVHFRCFCYWFCFILLRFSANSIWELVVTWYYVYHTCIVLVSYLYRGSNSPGMVLAQVTVAHLAGKRGASRCFCKCWKKVGDGWRGCPTMFHRKHREIFMSFHFF